MPVELTTNYILFYLALGLAAGTFSAAFGVGAGVIMVPAMVLFATMPQKEAQGLSLCVMVPMALMGAYRYHINPDIHIDWKLVLILGIGCIIGANLGASIAARASNKVLQFGFAIILFVIGARMIWASVRG